MNKNKDFLNKLNDQWIKDHIKCGDWTPQVCLDQMNQALDKHHVKYFGGILVYDDPNTRDDGDETWQSNGSLIVTLGIIDMMRNRILERMSDGNK